MNAIDRRRKRRMNVPDLDPFVFFFSATSSFFFDDSVTSFFTFESSFVSTFSGEGGGVEVELDIVENL